MAAVSISLSHYASDRIPNDRKRFALDAQPAQRHAWQFQHKPGRAIHHRLDESGPNRDAVVGHRRGEGGHLDRRDGHISLADRSGNSLARQPLFASNLLLPVSRWDDSEPLGWKLDAGRAAEAKQ